MMIIDLNDVTFTNVLNPEEGGEVFSVIDTDTRLAQMNCLLWLCSEPGMAGEACKVRSAVTEMNSKLIPTFLSPPHTLW